MTDIAQRSSSNGRSRHDRAQRGRARRPALGSLALKAALVAGVLCLTGCPVAYILWPRWPDPVSLDAPALPITVGGLLLNVPPAAIRLRIQRRAGAQDRIDLAFLWPSLEPPDPAAKPASVETLQQTDRVFLTIATSDGSPTPFERLKTIYPRYGDGGPKSLPDGLNLQTFRTGTPYQNEDLFYDVAAAERFIVRCTRKNGLAPGICLYERRIAATDITLRFPRDWLSDWRGVAGSIDRLITNLHPAATR